LCSRKPSRRLSPRLTKLLFLLLMMGGAILLWVAMAVMLLLIQFLGRTVTMMLCLWFVIAWFDLKWNGAVVGIITRVIFFSNWCVYNCRIVEYKYLWSTPKERKWWFSKNQMMGRWRNVANAFFLKKNRWSNLVANCQYQERIEVWNKSSVWIRCILKRRMQWRHHRGTEGKSQTE